MKGKQLLILLVVVAVLGSVAYLLKDRSARSESVAGNAGGKVVDFPLNDVAEVHLKATGSELHLVKKNDTWSVQERGDYAADFEQVARLLRVLWDLKTVQEVKVGASQLPRLELNEPGKAEPSGTLVELKGADGKTLSSLLLGKKHLGKSQGGPMGEMGGIPTGRYVMPLGGNGKVSLVAEPLEEAETKPERWLQKDFIKVDNVKAITLAGAAEPMRWTLTRENSTADWKLTGAKPEEQIDSAKTSSAGMAFAQPAFKDVLLPDAKPEDTGLNQPTTVTFETFDGFTYILKIGKLANEAHPVQIAVSANLAKERTPGKDEKPEDKAKLDEEFKQTQKRLETKLAAEKKFESRAYLFEKPTLDPLLLERTALLAPKPPAPDAAAASGSASGPPLPPAPAPNP